MYEIKNITNDIIAVSDSMKNRIEVKPGEQIEIDRPIEGQGIVLVGEEIVDKKSKSKKNKYEEVE